jgi:hypothetical protein
MREKQQLQQPITYRAGPHEPNGGDSTLGRVTPGEIIIARIGCLVRSRHLSEELGRVARVPHPHHDVLSRRGPTPFAKKFLRLRSVD